MQIKNTCLLTINLCVNFWKEVTIKCDICWFSRFQWGFFLPIFFSKIILIGPQWWLTDKFLLFKGDYMSDICCTYISHISREKCTEQLPGVMDWTRTETTPRQRGWKGLSQAKKMRRTFLFTSAGQIRACFLPLSITNLQGLSIKAAGGKTVHNHGKI